MCECPGLSRVPTPTRLLRALVAHCRPALRDATSRIPTALSLSPRQERDAREKYVHIPFAAAAAAPPPPTPTTTTTTTAMAYFSVPCWHRVSAISAPRRPFLPPPFPPRFSLPNIPNKARPRAVQAEAFAYVSCRVVSWKTTRLIVLCTPHTTLRNTMSE